MSRPTSSIEYPTIKDQYETPSHVWRYAVDKFNLNRDANASSLNAVLPAYDTPATESVTPGARYWLNPAYGTRCGGLEAVLSRYVWQAGCAVVALLPTLLHTSW